jgi:hypothetical protein
VDRAAAALVAAGRAALDRRQQPSEDWPLVPRPAR